MTEENPNYINVLIFSIFFFYRHVDKAPPVPRRFVCRMKCAFSCSSRFYTAYRAFQFSGHLRKSTIQEGRQERTLNTLVVFATPLSNNINNNSSIPSEATNNAFDFSNKEGTLFEPARNRSSSNKEHHKEMQDFIFILANAVYFYISADFPCQTYVHLSIFFKPPQARILIRKNAIMNLQF